MKLIPLTRGKFAKVDDADFDLVNQFTWHFDGNYAARTICLEGGVRKTQLMHALIMNTPPGHHTHHINNNQLDNRKKNLRILTRSEHQHITSGLRVNNTSGFRGVCPHTQVVKGRRYCYWLAQMYHEGQRIYVGCFHDPKEAAHAFDAKARILGWPEDGLNFPNL